MTKSEKYRKRKYLIEQEKYSKKELWKYREYKFKEYFREQNKEQLITIEFIFWYQERINSEFAFLLNNKTYRMNKNVLLAYDYYHSKFYCQDKEILTEKELIKYKEAVMELLLPTFNRITRTFDIPTQSPFGRCLWCSRKLLGQNRKPKKCCYKYKGKITNCSYYFFQSYSWATLADYIAQRDNYTCQNCKKEDLEDWDIDHIIEIANGKTNYEAGKLFMDQSNLQVLCKECHKQKTSLFLSERFTKVKKEKIFERKGLRSKKLTYFI